MTGPLLKACRLRLASGDEQEWQLEGDGGTLPRDPATFALRALETSPAPPRAARRRDVRPSANRAPTPGAFRRAGWGWVVGLGETRVQLPDAKGLHYLARLLAEPDREIHVLDLAGAGQSADSAPAGPVLDQQAKAAYRRRVRELEEEIEEAQAWNDHERATRAVTEREAVARELTAAVGLGGRDRMAAAGSERARVSVRKAIAAAVARIGEHDSELALLLETTVKTGTYCRYSPDPRLPVSWEF